MSAPLKKKLAWGGIALGLLGAVVALSVGQRLSSKPQAGRQENPPAALPSSPVGVVKPAEREQTPVYPLRVTFEILPTDEMPPAEEAEEPIPVTLLIQGNPDVWPKVPQTSQRLLNLLLRLPPGVRLQSDDWIRKDLPPREKEDPSGPWSLYSWEMPLGQTLRGESVLARVPLPLEIVEEGTNWIITARAQVVGGEPLLTTFGTLFATRRGEQAQFHPNPQPEYVQQPIPLQQPTQPNAQKD